MTITAGHDSLSGHTGHGTPGVTAAEGQTSPQANSAPPAMADAPAGNGSSHGQRSRDTQCDSAVAANSLSGQTTGGTRRTTAAEGSPSPQVNESPVANSGALAGINLSHGQSPTGGQAFLAVADHFPGGHSAGGTRKTPAAGDSSAGWPAAGDHSSPMPGPSLADPLLALAADVLDDLEKVRIANENRLRQLTRSAEDSDGEIRGFGLDEGHPDVARLAALVKMLADAEHQAELNLGRLMRNHPLGPWVKATAGIGVKQGARLIAALGDPYVRPEIVRKDGAVEPSRARLVSELWAYCGYHVISTPVSAHTPNGTPRGIAADGHDLPADPNGHIGTPSPGAGGDQGHSGPGEFGAHFANAGVAPKRQRGARANWSATAKMRAYLVAVSCMKHMESPYRAVYDDTRAKYAGAVHQVACIRCGPKNTPAEPGSALSDGHKHARALRAVAKEVLRDLWREARRIHELPGSPTPTDPQLPVASGTFSHDQDDAA